MIDWIKKKMPHWISSTILIWDERQYDIIYSMRESISKERIWFKNLAQERGQYHINISMKSDCQKRISFSFLFKEQEHHQWIKLFRDLQFIIQALKKKKKRSVSYHWLNKKEVASLNVVYDSYMRWASIWYN